jgi:hypothetical protein
VKRPHADLIKKWADNDDSHIWYYNKYTEEWEKCPLPIWEKTVQYAVILKEYAEAWQAWMDGELQVVTVEGKWTEWPGLRPPSFDAPASNYRRKPAEPKPEPVKPQPGEKWKHITGTVVVVTGEKSGVLIEKSPNERYEVGDLRHDWTFPGRNGRWTKVS